MAYVELHCHSAYSFLDGASHPDELAAAAAEQGHGALALTDHDGLHGAMEFARAAGPLGVRPIAGAELTLEDGHHLTVLCADRSGWRNLCRLITRAHSRTRGSETPRPAGRAPMQTATSGDVSTRSRPLAQAPQTTLADLEHHAEGLICLSGCARDGALAARVGREEHAAAARAGERLLEIFGADRFRVELQRPFSRNDRRRNRLLAELAGRLGVPVVATGNVHVHDRSRSALQDALVAVRLGATLDESEPGRRGNRSHVLAPPEKMAERFRDHPDAVEESARIAERIEFDLTRDLGYTYPGAEDPTAGRRLAEICRSKLTERYGDRRDARERLEEELRLIGSLGLEGFFVLHREILELAREVALEVRGADAARNVLPPGRGRGSSVSSIVCYLTGLSHIDPIENRLFLGRFLSDGLTSLPDIDLDFPRDIRERLIPRVHECYGQERSALVATFPTYRVRGAIRDFGKVLGLPVGEIERAARSADPWQADRSSSDISEAIGSERAGSIRWRALSWLVRASQGLPRHVGQHPGGMVVSTRPLIDICPIQPAAMEGRQIVQWDKDSCSDAGFLKIDLLGLGMLSAVEDCVTRVARARGEQIDLSRIPLDDPEVYDCIQRADTMGVFQIESRAQMQSIVRTRPENLDDLTVQVALIRPGPIQGGAVHPYIERRKRLRADPAYEIPYEHPSLEPILAETLGAIVFQDQVLEVAIALAGFSPAEAEGLRRAMSRRRSEAAMRSYEVKFIEGAIRNGASHEIAERVYAKVVAFSGFGFPKAHSAAFGLLAYQSTWLRVHYGPEFLCALLNEQPMGFYPPDALVHEAQRRSIEVLGPCVLASEVDCGVERADGELAVRIGLGHVNGVKEEDVRGIFAERERGGPFGSVADLAARCGARRDSLERLAWAGACDALVEHGRREALWLLGAASGARIVPAGTQLSLGFEPAPAPALRELGAWERMLADYGSTNVTLAEHPLALMRPELPEELVTSADLARLPNGSRIRVAGLVVARQRPQTANGITFMLLEDEHGMINLIVPVEVYERNRMTVRSEILLSAAGKLERREGVTNVLVSEMVKLERPDLPRAEVRHIEPRVAWSTEEDGASEGELRAVLPRPQSFGGR